MGKVEVSAEREHFSSEIKEIHEQLKQQLQDSSQKYKSRGDLKRREANFEVGDLVLAHLRKERFPRGKYNKLNLKTIGPCNILRKFSANAYEIELPPDIGISPIFNVSDLYRYEEKETDISAKNKEE